MSDDAELIARLRKQSSAGRANHVSKADRLAAADRIEELEALVKVRREDALELLAAHGQAQEAYEAQLKAEARADAAEAERDKHRRNWEQAFNANTALEAQIAAITAQVERLTGALEFYSCKHGCNGCTENERDLIGCGWTARAALSATTEEGHE